MVAYLKLVGFSVLGFELLEKAVTCTFASSRSHVVSLKDVHACSLLLQLKLLVSWLGDWSHVLS